MREELASTGLLLLPERSAQRLILLLIRKSLGSSSRPSLLISMASNQRSNPGMESANKLPNPMEKDWVTGGAAKNFSFPDWVVVTISSPALRTVTVFPWILARDKSESENFTGSPELASAERVKGKSPTDRSISGLKSIVWEDLITLR